MSVADGGRTAARALARVLAVVLLVATACGRHGEAAPADDVHGAIAVSAAASLGAAFRELATAFEGRHPGATVRLNLAGSQTLAAQIVEHGPVDVFASADEANMAKVVAAGRVAGAPVELARNRLAVVVRAGNPRGVRGVADLARPDLKVALCGPTVPAGRYARELLQRVGVTVRSVSDEPSVSALVAKIELGELDAGIAYRTDARAGKVDALPVQADQDVVASYPIVVLDGAANPAGGRAFVAFCRGERGRAVLGAHGFELP